MTSDNMSLLALSPHADDVELGAGATIARFARIMPVYVIVFSLGTSLSEEVELSKFILGVYKYDVLGYVTREFINARQHILDYLIALKKELIPSYVLVPCTTDVHQDHQVITIEAIRCFKVQSTILGYELPWNNVYTQELRYFVRIDSDDLDIKLKAIGAFSSQASRNYMQPGYIRSLATTRGVQAGSQFAEAFEPIRIIT